LNIDFEKMLKAYRLRNIGWSVYIVECKNKVYYAGMARNIKKELAQINVLKKGRYFNKQHPERVPVTVVFEEKNLPFREAYAKFSYLKGLNRVQREKLIRTKKWNSGWRLYSRGVRNKIEIIIKDTR
jgi:predicted GIY-YIG superfamily endonuclease